MAVTATFQTLHDGMRNAVVQVNLTADSVGDINPTIAVDVSAMTPPAKSVKIKRASWTVEGGTVHLLWDGYAEDAPALLMAGQGVMDYCGIGGMPSQGVPPGDLLLKTSGFTAGSTATIELELRKKL
jgi:hypothetical protein